MSFLKKQIQPVAAPKNDHASVIDVKFADLNHVQRERTRRLLAGERRSSLSMVILDHRHSELLQELIHEMKVIPVIDDHGVWTLFHGKGQ
jgi:hypothetical protein